MSKSEVAMLREQLALEEQAMRLGLYGPAIVANHAAINARMQRGAERILTLFQEGKQQEAVALMDTPDWGEPDPTSLAAARGSSLHEEQKMKKLG